MKKTKRLSTDNFKCYLNNKHVVAQIKFYPIRDQTFWYLYYNFYVFKRAHRKYNSGRVTAATVNGHFIQSWIRDSDDDGDMIKPVVYDVPLYYRYLATLVLFRSKIVSLAGSTT